VAKGETNDDTDDEDDADGDNKWSDDDDGVVVMEANCWSILWREKGSCVENMKTTKLNSGESKLKLVNNRGDEEG
jgi:hypothetical protein